MYMTNETDRRSSGVIDPTRASVSMRIVRKVLEHSLFPVAILCTAVLAWGQVPSRDTVTATGTRLHLLLTDKLEAQVRTQAAAPCTAPCNLIYTTGPVMRNPTNYLIFCAPPNLYNRATFPAGYQAGNEKYFQNLGGTPFYNIVTLSSSSHVLGVSAR
jgi:hypothetical protein